MEFEKSEYSINLQYFKLEKPFGNFYLCNHFFISELNDGVHFGWSMINDVMKDIIAFYGENNKIGYVSNRINSYSMNPHNWNKVDEIYGIIAASAVVYHNEIMYMNATIEKQLSDKAIKRCESLKEAIDWIINLKELK